MLRKTSCYRVATAAVLFLGAALAACRPAEDSLAAGDPSPSSEGKIPITTASPEALELFLQGRDLADRLRGTEARTYFEQALVKDSKFALAHLALANTAPSAQNFFDSLERAVSSADHASDGERLVILGQDAGVRSDPAAQRDYYTRLIEEYPADERAHILLAAFHFGRQDYDAAIRHYGLATEIAPDFSAPFNMLGYAYRATGHFEEAEEAFKRYVELIPDEPNPYDSYAELLMKIGRFEESIANYRKALEINSNFVFSFVGIGHNQILMGDPVQARDTYVDLLQAARNEAERRTAFFWETASYVHEGDYAQARKACQKMQDVAVAQEDWAAVSGDLVLKGFLYLEEGQTENARASFGESLDAMARADVNDDVKDALARNHLYRLARVEIAEGALERAAAQTEVFAEEVSERNIPTEVRLVHELQGRIALVQSDFQGALEHLAQANQQDPRVLYQMAVASAGAGRKDEARELASRAANFNQLTMNFALVRSHALRFLAEL